MAQPSPRALADLALLKARYPAAQTTTFPSGNVWVSLDLPIPVGWGVTTVKLWFFVPPEYPATPPDCFWVDPMLKVNGNPPTNTQNSQPMPDLGRSQQWFSWHINNNGQWDGNRDTLTTWVNSCRQRLDQVK